MNRFRGALVTLLAAGTLAGCGSTVSGQAQPAGAAVEQSGGSTGSLGGPTEDAGKSGGNAPNAAPGTGVATDGVSLIAKLDAGMRDVTSLKGELTMQVAGQSINATMAETVENAKVKDAKMTMDFSGMNMELLLVDGKTYLGGDPSLLSGMGVKQSGKKYALVSEDSANPQLAAMATQLKRSLQQSGPDGYKAFAASTTSVKAGAGQTVNGVPTTRYDLVIDVAKLAEQMPNSELSGAGAIGLDTIPVSLWLDEQNRPVKMVEKVEAGGMSASVEFTVGGYNEPVRITAPDPSEVATGG